VYWIVVNARDMGLNALLSLFDGAGASALRFFFSSIWPPIVYAILLGVAGHFANLYAVRRTAAQRKQ
jgi:hypothetical protein